MKHSIVLRICILKKEANQLLSLTHCYNITKTNDNNTGMLYQIDFPGRFFFIVVFVQPIVKETILLISCF